MSGISDQLASPRRWKGSFWGGFSLIGMVFLAYLPALGAGYIWDDGAVTENRLLLSASGLWKLWSDPSKETNPYEEHYWPLTYTTFWLENRLWGLHPSAHHLINVGLHALNAALFWRVLRRLDVPGAWLAAAIFGIHPLHVESVAWIIERKNVLSTLFYLAAALMFLRSLQSLKSGRTAYAASLFFFVLGMLSKTSVAGLPVALAICLWWRPNLAGRRALSRLTAMLAVSAGMSVWDVWVVRHHAHTKFGFTLLERMIIAGQALWHYTGKLLWPVNLIAAYPRWVIYTGWAWAYLFPAGLIAVLVLSFLGSRATCKGALAAVLFFIVALAPLLSFIDFGWMNYAFAADRFQYLADLGPISLFAASVASWLRRRPALRGLAAAGLLGALLSLTWRQGSLYRDPASLYRHSLERNPSSALMHYNLGTEYGKRGESDQAAEEYGNALSLNPYYFEAHNNLGALLVQKGKFTAAMEHYRAAKEIRPQFFDVYWNMAIALRESGDVPGAVAQLQEALRFQPHAPQLKFTLGKLAFDQGRFDEAIGSFNDALGDQPNLVEARAYLGYSLAQEGRTREAIEQLKKALAMKQGMADVHTKLGVLLGREGKIEEAVTHHQEALRIEPNNAEAHNNLGVDLLASGRVPEAVAHLERAVQISPEYAEARNNLALGLIREKKFPEAETEARQAARLQPKFCEAFNTLGIALANQGKFGEAVGAFSKALESCPAIPEYGENLERAKMGRIPAADRKTSLKTKAPTQ